MNTSADEYMRMIAICRIMLPNIIEYSNFMAYGWGGYRTTYFAWRGK